MEYVIKKMKLFIVFYLYSNQQHPLFFFSSAAVLFYVNFVAPFEGILGFGDFSFYRLALTALAIVKKASATFVPSFAEVSKKGTPNYLANASPSSLETCLFGTSILFPNINEYI